jgi:D-alanine-D-alanine ligase
MGEKAKLRVTVLFGGQSGEHEISIRSARSVVDAIDRHRFEPTLVGIDRQGGWHFHGTESFRRLTTDAAEGSLGNIALVSRYGAHCLIETEQGGRTVAELDVIFPVLHGPFGEDGRIQGLLEMFGIPYVGAGVLGSAVGMDKDVQKRLLRDAGIAIVPFLTVRRAEWERAGRSIRERVSELGMPIFVKPANLGSSVGISKVHDDSELAPAVAEAFGYDDKIVIEKGIDAREIECSVLGNDEPAVSVLGEIVPAADFYSYEAKYSAGSQAKLLIPAPLDEDLAKTMRASALRVFRVLECSGMARVDYLLERTTSTPYVNELNTMPGFTSISMYPKLWEATGLGFSELVTRLIDLAMERDRAARSRASKTKTRR